MSATAKPLDANEPFIEEILDCLLTGWSGLRHYVANRRIGQPADPVMESLLRELLRLQLDDQGDIERVVDYLETEQ